MGFWEPLFFWIFATGAVLSSIAVIVFRNPLYSALSLILDFFFFAGLYGLLSAHLMAITQVLVYAGAIMVLFLFIIMLLNLKDDELGVFEFKIHHLVSFLTVVGLFYFVSQAITPLVDMEKVTQARAQAAQQLENDKKAHAKLVEQADAAQGDEKVALLARVKESKPKYKSQSRTAVKGPLYADLSEGALDEAWSQRIQAYDSGRSVPSQGKWPRFDKTRPVIVPPVLTGKELKNDRGHIRASAPATFGTIEPLSVLIVNRFVVPFELTALLLLAAIVGAVIIAKRRL